MNSKKVIVVLHRYGSFFLGGYVNYSKAIDHDQHDVIYFVNDNGYGDITPHKDKAAAVYRFADLGSLDAVDEAMVEVLDRFGRVDHVVSMSEYDLDIAAYLRTKHGIPGTTVEQAQLFRDKVKSKERLQADNIRVPKFLDVTSVEETLAFADEIGFPLILKPKNSAASVGVKRIESREELSAILVDLDMENYECEEFVVGPIFHIDGLVYQGNLEFISVSRYIGSCLGFSEGKPCGSVLIQDDENLRDLMTDFTARCIRSLELNNGCFHMELIYKNEVEPVFLEIGARIGGAEIPFFTLDRFGINLCEESARIETGTYTGVPKQEGKIHGGFLQFPEPRNTPLEVVSVTSLMEEIPEIFSEQIPKPGEIMDGKGMYYHISGRYMYRGESDAQVEAAIRKTIECFRLEGKPIEVVEV